MQDVRSVNHKRYENEDDTSAGTVTSVASGAGLTGGPITSTGTLSLEEVGDGGGSATLASITVDGYGRVISFTDGTKANVVDSFSGGTTGLTGVPAFGDVVLEGVLEEVNGGTGQSTYATGDVLYASGANTLAKLPAGGVGEVLTVAGGVPTWAPAAGGSNAYFEAEQNVAAFDILAAGPSVDHDVPGCTITLDPGTYMIGFNTSVFLDIPAGPYGAVRFQITTAANVSVPRAAQGYFSGAVNRLVETVVCPVTTFLVVGSTTTYKLRVQCNSPYTICQSRTGIASGAIPDPDHLTSLWAVKLS